MTLKGIAVLVLMWVVLCGVLAIVVWLLNKVIHPKQPGDRFMAVCLLSVVIGIPVLAVLHG